MKDDKFKIMELFLYVVIVVVGLLFLLFGKPELKLDSGLEPPAAETIQQERGEPSAALHDEQ